VKTITVQVKEDHLETLARTKPMTALAELIWNALDAEASHVRVEFIENELEGLDTIRIVDDGQGLHYDDAFIVFQNLGGSWKRRISRTTERRRVLHGKYGKGRFRAFSLGNRVSWTTVYEEAGNRYGYSITGDAAELGAFSVTDARGAIGQPTGMVVEITNLADSAQVLRGVKALEEVTETFALYLKQYPDLRLVYDGVPIDPASAERNRVEYALEEIVMENGERVNAMLSVVEWLQPGRRGVYLCDADGFMRHNALPRLHFRGFSYTAYVKSDYIATLDAQGLLETGELCSDVAQLLDAARAKLREHFTLREAERAQDTLRDWKDLGLYPYDDEPRSDIDATERRIFDIYSTHLNQILPEWAASRPRLKRLTLRLLQELIRTQPTRVAQILDELVDFPEEKQEEVLELMQNEAASSA